MGAFKRLYLILRHCKRKDWDIGIERDRHNWKIGYYSDYYDGQWRALWIGCFYICNWSMVCSTGKKFYLWEAK